MEFATTRVEEYLAFFRAWRSSRSRLGSRGISWRNRVSRSCRLSIRSIGRTGIVLGEDHGDSEGVGIEIGIVVGDIDQAYAAALLFKDKGFRFDGDCAAAWGSRDFGC